MKTCPFFNICGGCQYDFSDKNYQSEKTSVLPAIDFTHKPIWGNPGVRRRADFAFADGHFGFYHAQSKDIIDINTCPNLLPEINAILPAVSLLPWSGSGSVLITQCENGTDINITSIVQYCNNDFKNAVAKLPASIIRVTWNGKDIRKYATPEIKFNNKILPYTSGAFLQPSIETEQILRDLVIKYAGTANKVADLFCGLGNFTFATNAHGFDIFGNGTERDLFKKPLSANNLNQYEIVIMDPPRAGAMAQSKELAKSIVKRIIYVSCNPNTFIRDKRILENGGYKMTTAIPIDQFIGTKHWEIFSVFDKSY